MRIVNNVIMWQTDYNPNCFWIVTVQSWFKISPANAYHPIGTLNFSYVTDTDNLLVKNSKISSAVLIINE